MTEMNHNQMHALKEFQRCVGDGWRHAVALYNLGQVGAVRFERTPEKTDFVAYLRQIRNRVTANPSKLPDLRDES